jgi:RNA recognition motif-containing protein
MLEKNHNGNSALVTYDTCKSARLAVTQLSNEIWNGKEIKVNPSHIRTSIHASRQNCKLKAYWFMTESECNGRVEFSQPEAAVRANEFFKERKYHSRIQLNTINPTIKCTWPLVPHTSKATVYFQTAEQAQDVRKYIFLSMSACHLFCTMNPIKDIKKQSFKYCV